MPRIPEILVDLEKDDPTGQTDLTKDASVEQGLAKVSESVADLNNVTILGHGQDADPAKAPKITRVLLKRLKRKIDKEDCATDGRTSTTNEDTPRTFERAKASDGPPVLNLADARYRARKQSPPIIIDEATGIRYKLVSDTVEHNMFIPRNGKAPIQWGYVRES